MRREGLDRRSMESKGEGTQSRIKGGVQHVTEKLDRNTVPRNGTVVVYDTLYDNERQRRRKKNGRRRGGIKFNDLAAVGREMKKKGEGRAAGFANAEVCQR